VSFRLKFILLFSCSFTIGSLRSQVIEDNPAELRGVNVAEHLGERIPLNLEFTDDHGARVKLAQYFQSGKPVIMQLAYYRCPMLCTMVLNGITESVKELAWIPGNEFQMVTISIDPMETAELASAKKDTYLKFLDKQGAETGWHFLTGGQEEITKIAKALGFQYFYDETQKQYAHPAVVFILGEDGKISRYLYGLQFKERDVRLGLIEASEGKVGNTLDKLILYCYHYDPQAKGYVVLANNVMKLGGVVIILAMGILLTILWRKEKQRKDKEQVSV